jgi:FixJ family two-component response regulator
VHNLPIQPSNTTNSTVYIVDDDESIRASLSGLLCSVGLHVRAFETTQGFLEASREQVPSCLILDVRLPGESGLMFQQHALKLEIAIPIIFITGHGDIAMTVAAMKAGAVDMLDAVASALARDAERLEKHQAEVEVRENYKTLTPREREVVTYVIAGYLNKQIAGRMNVSEITVKIHRGSAMKKMAVRCVPDLVRKAQTLGVHPATPDSNFPHINHTSLARSQLKNREQSFSLPRFSSGSDQTLP